MNSDEFLSFSKSRFVSGQRELAAAMQALVKREEPEIHEVLASCGEHAFLEPLVFTSFRSTSPAIGLAQIVFGYLPRELRPGGFPLNTDAKGHAYLPNLGHLSTVPPRPNAPLDASVIETVIETAIESADEETGALALSDGDAVVGHTFRPRRLVDGTAIELLWESNPLLDEIFTNTRGERVNDVVPGVSLEHEDHVAKAFALIRRYQPEYYELVRAATRQVFVFAYPDVNCFASLNAHGIAFLNAQRRDDEIFCVDELVHQCGHIIFNAMTVRRQEFFAKDPDAVLFDLGVTDRKTDDRSLYTVYHGLYTEQAMVRCLRALDEQAVFSGRKAHELRGRLSFIARKMRFDIGNMSHRALYTPLGEELFETFLATYRDVEREREDLFRLDLRGQPYNFDYDMFARRNPPLEQFSAAE